MTEKKPIGNFYQTSYPLKPNNLYKLLNQNRVIYRNSARLPSRRSVTTSKDVFSNNIINDVSDNINPSNGLFGKLMDLLKGGE